MRGETVPALSLHRSKQPSQAHEAIAPYACNGLRVMLPHQPPGAARKRSARSSVHMLDEVSGVEDGTAAGFLAAFLTGDFLAAFLAGDFLAAAFLAGAFLTADFLAAAFLAGDFLAAAFLAGAFLVADFFTLLLAVVFFAAFLVAAFAMMFASSGYTHQTRLPLASGKCVKQGTRLFQSIKTVALRHLRKHGVAIE